jgi:hypothetical protein
MEHPSYSPDPASCDFFLLNAMSENFSGQYIESVDELFLAVEAFLRRLSAGFVQVVFLEWEKSFQVRYESGGEYIE